MIGTQIFGTILASKLELMMTGLLLLSAAILLESRRHWCWLMLSAVTLSMILNWKFQPLPSAGLLTLLWVISRRD
jgi:hypothetical protein